MSDSKDSNTSSKGHEETHNSDTLVDETGTGHHIQEVPSVRQLVETHDDEEPKKSRGWMPVMTVLGFLVLVTIIGLAVGLAKRNDDDDDNTEASSITRKVTWVPLGAPVVPNLDQAITNFDYSGFDSDGTNLVLTDLSTEDLAQVKWYVWNNDSQDGPAWEWKSTMPVGDGHQESHPMVKVAAGTLVVADAQAFEQTNGGEQPEAVYHGLVTIYDLQEDQEEPFVRHQVSAGDLFGSSIALDDTAKTLAVGTPLAGQGQESPGAVHVYNPQALTLESIGRPLYGPNFLSTLGGTGLALSGDGKVVAATAAGQVSIWRWTDAAKDWSDRAVTLGPGIGSQVVLNQDGTVLATTTFNNRVIVYHYVCENRFNCGWDLRSTIPGNFVAMEGKTNRLAVGHEENDEAMDMIQVYEYNQDGDKWEAVGSGIPGVAAVWMDENHILIQQKELGNIQTWQLAGL